MLEEREMKTLAFAFVVATTVLAACSSLGIVDPGPEQRAARNRCEAMRSYRPYYPNECGELNGPIPFGYGTE
jgi:hypothetical protein